MLLALNSAQKWATVVGDAEGCIVGLLVEGAEVTTLVGAEVALATATAASAAARVKMSLVILVARGGAIAIGERGRGALEARCTEAIEVQELERG